MKRVILFSLTLLLAFASQVQAQTTPQAIAKSIVEESSKKIRDVVLSAKTDEEMRDKVKLLMETFVDFPEFGRICLIDFWTNISQPQRDRYLVEFKKLLQRSYLRHFKKGRDFKLIYRGEPILNDKGDRVMVQTTLNSGDVTADVDYRFYSANGKWIVYDIIVDEVSISRNYRKSFSKVMEKDGFEALIVKMAKKSTESGEDDNL